MHSGQIQQAIARGVAPFALCRIVSANARTSHKRGVYIQDAIGSALHSLSQLAADTSAAPQCAEEASA